jgi:hypothetical protein
MVMAMGAMMESTRLRLEVVDMAVDLQCRMMEVMVMVMVDMSSVVLHQKLCMKVAMVDQVAMAVLLLLCMLSRLGHRISGPG